MTRIKKLKSNLIFGFEIEKKNRPDHHTERSLTGHILPRGFKLVILRQQTPALNEWPTVVDILFLA